MCIDQAGWRFKPYPKHETPASYRDSARTDIDRMTRNADSRYYPEHSVQDLEGQVVERGVYVRSPQRHKVCKIHEFPGNIGASNGEPSRWVRVEITNGEYHGRPITADEFSRNLSRQIPCCP